MVKVRPGAGASTFPLGCLLLAPKSERGYDDTDDLECQELRNCVTMLAVQSKMARAALGWGVRKLAAEAGVSPDTIARLERGESLYPRTAAAIRSALEAAGVEFIAENGGGAGVRLRKGADEPLS